MIAADKNLLRATLTRGMLALQLKLIDLYVNNLNALSISGVLISGFAYTVNVYSFYCCFHPSSIPFYVALSPITNNN
jgi:hypothetical protein